MKVRVPLGRTAALLLLLALAPPAHAAPLFSSPSLVFETGRRPTSVAIADLNRDGRPDLAVAKSEAVAVLFGRGDGTFAERTEVATGFYPQSVAIADLNGDSVPDLVTANAGLSAVSVMLGGGDGTFRVRADYGPGIGARSVAIAAIDGDERPDLVTERSVFLGNGDGTFGSRMDFNGGSTVAIGDFNGDGRPDLATNGGPDPDEDDFVGVGSVLLGSGDGTFGTPMGFETGYLPCAMATADFNADGRADLAVANYGHTPDYIGTFSVLAGNGDGTFGVRRDYDTGANPIAIAAADLNGDGHPDVVTADFGDDPDWSFVAHTISVFLGNGDGTFRSAPKVSVGENPLFVAVGDIDGNGTQDLVTPNWTANTLSVALGNGDGTFGTPGYPTSGEPWSLAIGDLDGDGNPDMATASAGPYPSRVGTVSVLLGKGDGTFRPGASFGTGSPRYSLTIADFNEDGRPDLAMCLYSGFNGASFVSIALGRGDGTFGTLSNFASGSASFSIKVADLNADGHLDVVTANVYPSTIAVLLGNGDGTLRARTELSTGSYPYYLAIGDLNGDGRPDLVTANTYYPRTFSVLLGNGDGTFAPRRDLPAGIGASNDFTVSLADMNLDGKLDLVGGGIVMLGNGDGNFGAITTYLPGLPRYSSVADFDGDGRLDVAAAYEEQDGDVAVVLGKGDGTFEFEGRYGAGKGPNSITAADLDRDGRPDLAVANVSSKSVSWMRNLGRTPAPTTLRFAFTPKTLNRGSRGRWVTGLLEPLPPLSAKDIDISSIRLSGTVPVDPAAPTEFGDHDGNGVVDLTVKFDRAAVEATVSEGDSVPVTVSGKVGGHAFSGTDFIRVRGLNPLAAAAEDGPLSIRAASPTTVGRLAVQFTLRDASPARLELIDVAGRVLASREVGAMGAGPHSLDFAGERSVPPGAYFLRVTQGWAVARARVAILQ